MGPVQAFYAVLIQAYDVVSVQANYAVSSQANHVQSVQAYYAVCLVYISNINSLDDSKSSENLGSIDAPPDRYRIATATKPDTRRRAHSASPWLAYALSGFRMLVAHQDPKAQPLRLNRNEKVSRASEWDHILFDIMLETDVPAHEELVKWCGRFPQYREKLASHFVWWALDNICCDEPQQLIPLTDEERYAPELDSPEAEKFALEILHRHGRLMPPPPVTSLGLFDHAVLAAVYQLRGHALLAGIKHRITQTLGTCVLPAAISVCLDRLEKLGLIIRSDSEGDIFKITVGGKRALAKITTGLEDARSM